jgi:enoyl-CoA hydratase/carnithine racemase
MERMMNPSEKASSVRPIRLERRLPSYWRVTFDHPPLNIFGPETIPQPNEIVSMLETDERVKVVVFDSAVDGFFLTHYDFLAPLHESTSLPAGPTGLQQLPDMLVHLSRAPVVSIASIRGRATGVGSELSLASDMHFASREKAILSQWEVGAGLVPGGGPMARLIGRVGRWKRCLAPTMSGANLRSWMATSIASCRTQNLMFLSMRSPCGSPRLISRRSLKPSA